MCGILAIFRKTGNSVPEASKGFEEIKSRGLDGKGFAIDGKSADELNGSGKQVICHALHSIVGDASQPFIGKGILSANCEIYNWKELSDRYSLSAKNDAHALFLLLEKFGLEKLEELDGDYAFVYVRGGNAFLGRDLVGVKPLSYARKGDAFAAASEPKALKAMGFGEVTEASPKCWTMVDLESLDVKKTGREFYSARPELDEDENTLVDDLGKLLAGAVRKRVPEKKAGILFSGGLDSSIIAILLKRLGVEITAYMAVFGDRHKDLEYARKSAASIGIPLKLIHASEGETRSVLRKVGRIIETEDRVQMGIALPLYFASGEAGEDGVKVIFSGQGADDLFAGYHRFLSAKDINSECLDRIASIHSRDMFRDDAVTMHNHVELRVPFLDMEVIRYGLRIPDRYKIRDGNRKYILQKLAVKLGIPVEIALREKTAAQYGSGFDQALRKSGNGTVLGADEPPFDEYKGYGSEDERQP
ncbi:asparagine synthetase B [Candidatus Woesearchaeota archaeon]|nr:asparagine synthetase B [Candidatus Woesearchaeota archaeon]